MDKFCLNCSNKLSTDHPDDMPFCDEGCYYQYSQPKQQQYIPCPSCNGTGSWETECCSGAGGCSCGGGLVDMGMCNVCNGQGRVIEGQFNPYANSDYLKRSGACFAGSGPSYGYWAGKPALHRPSKL